MSSRKPGRHDFGGRPNTVVLLRESYTALNQLALERLADRGHGVIRPAHAAVFEHIDDAGTPVARLAERARVTKQAMAELVLHLEQHGYVTREPDPEDRRAKLVLPTAMGHQVFALMRELIPEIEHSIDELLGERRANAFRNDLERLLATSSAERDGH